MFFHQMEGGLWEVNTGTAVFATRQVPEEVLECAELNHVKVVEWHSDYCRPWDEEKYREAREQGILFIVVAGLWGVVALGLAALFGGE